MSDDYQDKVYKLLYETAYRWSPTALAPLEEAMRVADAHNDEALGVEVRQHYINHAQMTGHNDKAFVAFGWVLAKVDQDPDLERFAGNLMWFFKWILDSAPNFHTISRQQIEEVADDMARRYRERGLSLRAVERIRSQVARNMGDLEAAREHYRRGGELPKDGSQDCAACETNAEVYLYATLGELDEALRVGQPVLKGRQSCAEVPAATHSFLLIPLFDAGRLELADSYQRKSARRVTRDASLIDNVGEHLAFLAATGQHRRALNMLDKMLAIGLASMVPLMRLEFLAGVAVVARCLKRAGREAIKLKPVDGLDLATDDQGRVLVDAFDAHITAAATELAERFDERNGNTFISGRLAYTLGLAERPVELPPKKPKSAEA